LSSLDATVFFGEGIGLVSIIEHGSGVYEALNQGLPHECRDLEGSFCSSVDASRAATTSGEAFRKMGDSQAS